MTLFVLGQFKLAFKLSTSSLIHVCCLTVSVFITIKSQLNLPFSLRKEHHLYKLNKGDLEICFVFLYFHSHTVLVVSAHYHY